MAAVANPSSQPAAAAPGAGAAVPTTHQRVHLAAFGDLKVVTEPVPKAVQPGSAIVRVIATDVAANAAALFGGKVPYKPAPPMTPGGTCFGQVVAVADDVVGGPRPGAYVVVNRIFRQNEASLLVGAFSLTPPHVPAGAKQTELWKNGSWAQYALLPAAALIAVPDAVVKSTPAHIILRAITLSIAHGALVTRGRFAAGQTVLVGGATGIHGLATVLLALAFGADAVYVMGRSAAKLKALTALSARVKAVVTGDGSDEKALAAGMAVVGKSADVYVDFYPYLQTDALTLAGVNALKTGGVAALGGGVQAVLKLSYVQFLLQQLTITGTLMYPDDTIPLVLKLLGSGAIDTKAYAANEFVGLEHIHAAMNAATAGKEDAFKTVVIYPNGKPAIAAL